MVALYAAGRAVPGHLFRFSGTVNTANLIIARRRLKAAELPLDEGRKCERRAVFQSGADDLDADRKAALRKTVRRRRRRQARSRGNFGPDHLVEIRILLAVDVDAPR